MAADSDEHLRIASVELQPPASGYTVDASSRTTRPVVRQTCRSLDLLTDRLSRLHSH